MHSFPKHDPNTWIITGILLKSTESVNCLQTIHFESQFMQQRFESFQLAFSALVGRESQMISNVIDNSDSIRFMASTDFLKHWISYIKLIDSLLTFASEMINFLKSSDCKNYKTTMNINSR